MTLLGTPGAAAEPRQRTFRFTYTIQIPAIPPDAKSAQLWVPYPVRDMDQTVHGMIVGGGLSYEKVKEDRHHNQALRFTLAPGSAAQTIQIHYDVTRDERVNRPDGPGQIVAENPSVWLLPDKRVAIDGKIATWAQETVGDASTPIAKARAIYDYAVTELKYDKSGTGWGNGDIYWACDAKRGNCTDFHSLFNGYTRAVGVPSRFEIGFPIPEDRGRGVVKGYHCWAQFYVADRGWIPVDASEANKHPDKREYFFGAIDENRILMSIGRDLVLPGMQGKPLNYFVYPVLEVDGKATPVEKSFRYRDLHP